MDIKDEIMKLMKDYKNGVSFVEFEKKIGTSISGDFALEFPVNSKCYLWFNVSREFADAIIEFITKKRILLKHCDRLLYFVDGKLPKIPVAKRIPKNGYKSARWLPVYFDLG